jgi:hypothetical protein
VYDDQGITNSHRFHIAVFWDDTVKMGRLLVLRVGGREKALTLLMVETIYRVF